MMVRWMQSEDIVRKYAREDDRIKVISIENQGPSKARNVGLDLATGDYIRFVDADDRIPGIPWSSLCSLIWMIQSLIW